MLTEAAEAYVAMRRQCGFAFRQQGHHVLSFARFAAAAGNKFVCAKTAIRWAGLSKSVDARCRRLDDVIRFARYVRAEDRRHEVPPPVFGQRSSARPTPYILSAIEIQRLVHAASQAGYRTLRRHTYSTLFALLACTGLRVSEAIRLRYEDITPDGLLIRCTKFRKDRLVPLHQTAQAGLQRYLARRRAYAPFDDHVFISLRRKPLLIEDAESAFRMAAKMVGLPCAPTRPRPTPHSLRHTFAVRSLEVCPDGRDQITQHMVALSTYLGHGNVENTFWYLESTPELMADIAKRCERFIAGARP